MGNISKKKEIESNTMDIAKTIISQIQYGVFRLMLMCKTLQQQMPT